MANGYDRFGLYHDAADARLIVPKRDPSFGWTVNVSHPYGPAALAGLGAVIAGGVLAGVLAALLKR